jgi:quinol-cytochrome oxidoreductase complex cytochrome b subunit
MAIGFLGYVLPYGQMSLWGYFTSPKCKFYQLTKICIFFSDFVSFFVIFKNTKKSNRCQAARDFIHIIFNISIVYIGIGNGVTSIKIRGIDRIGPHNFEIYSIIFGNLLGAGHAERSLFGGTRISFYQEAKHLSYLS